MLSFEAELPTQMAPFTVPPEVARRIANAVPHRHTLVVLTYTSRTLQSAAEKLLYDVVEFFPHPGFFSLLETLSICPRVATHVRTFMLNNGPAVRVHISSERELRRSIQAMTASPDFWTRVSESLTHLKRLDHFILTDETLEHSWVLDSVTTLQATDVRLHLAWDESVSAFLNTQRSLRYLYVSDMPKEAPPAGMSSDCLPCLTQFEGPVMALDMLLHCPLTHLRIPIDTEFAVLFVPRILPALNRFKKLRSLSITGLPPDILFSSLSSITTSCPYLQYLSLIPLPIDHKYVRISIQFIFWLLTLCISCRPQHLALLNHLSRLPLLRLLEFDIKHWTPPLTPPFQRAIAASLHVVLPALQYIFFWGRHERTLWTWNPDETEPIQVHSRPVRSSTTQEDEDGTPGARETDRQNSGAGEGAGAAGAGTGATIEYLEETTSYVGLEGWRHSWNVIIGNPSSSSVWKTAV